MNQPDLDIWHMRRALELAARGQGAVEPNPMAGCVIAHGAEIIGEGWHRRFGGDHAEVEALGLAGSRARGASLYATLEPCCHQGKTPPCTRAILAAGVGRVVAAMLDPFVQVAGGGLAELAAAGIAVDVGLLEDDARQLNAPYLKLLATGRPWVMAKWAMTLDGKIATRTGQSRWISGPLSREAVHRLRGRVDAILTGRGTVQRDDPLLTARPGDCPDFRGHHRAPTRSVGRHGRENGTVPFRTATRVVVDSRASLGSGSQLVRTAGEAPVLVAAGPEASEADRRRLSDLGCEVAIFDGPTPAARLGALLDDL
ncbi:MAG: bifunctional diaminohydroxyphosphoribosylaminopyrimidine deaminase/5-amino-6-(5-phosphoribosylamino)uracil reductase RibD, partial [Thermoguttaceae bacterium]